MINLEKVSIIVPFYNVQKEWLYRCLDSIINQTYKQIEIIIINDGSKKNYTDYLYLYCKRKPEIKIISTENKGLAAARNLGMENANGKYMIFIDSDDYISERTIEKMVKVAEQTKADIVTSHIKQVTSSTFEFNKSERYTYCMLNTGTSKTEMQKLALVGLSYAKNKNGFISCGPCAVLYDSELAKSFKFPEEIKCLEDVQWNYLVFSKARKVALLNETTYAYRKNLNSITHTWSLKMVEQRLQSLSLLEQTLENNKEARQWLAIRVLTSYSIICECCSYTNELSGIHERLKIINNIYKIKNWRILEETNIGKNWNLKYKIKRLLAVHGLLPIIYIFIAKIKG